MSKSLSVASIIEKNRLSSDVPWLICLDIDVVNPITGAVVQTMNLVRNTEEIVFNGHTYLPASFDIELREESGKQSSVNLTMNDHSLAVQSQMQLYGGGVGFNVAISVVNAGNLAQPPEVVEYFVVIGATSTNYTCTFTLGAENIITKTFPLRIQTRDYCQFRFKGVECGYQGAMTSCDLSLRGINGCEAHGNQANFGAFPGISNQNVSYG